MGKDNKKFVDGIDFLEKNLNTFYTPIFFKHKPSRVVGNRILAINAYINKLFGFKEMMNYFLPSRFKKGEIEEKMLIHLKHNVNVIFQNSGIYDMEAIHLFDKNFSPAHEGSKLESWLHTFIMIFQSILMDQYRMKRFLKEDSVVIDAGANIGAFSVFSAHTSQRGKIYSFEPNPETYSILLRNTGEYPNIEAFNFGLGDSLEEKDLILAENSGSSTIEDSGMGVNALSPKIKVQINTIDNFVRENGLTRVDFIKMDTEGYESKIIEGARETIQRFSPILSLSAYHHPEDKKKIPDLVRSINPKYKCKLTKKVEDNLLFYT